MIDNIKEFLGNCPFLSDIDININYLDESAVSGTVENLPGDPIIKTYTDGGSMRQCLFAISLRQYCGQNVELNSSAITLLEQISNWVEEQNVVGILPELDENQMPISIAILKTSEISDKTADTAKYQLQFKMVYYQE